MWWHSKGPHPHARNVKILLGRTSRKKWYMVWWATRMACEAQKTWAGAVASSLCPSLMAIGPWARAVTSLSSGLSKRNKEHNGVPEVLSHSQDLWEESRSTVHHLQGESKQGSWWKMAGQVKESGRTAFYFWVPSLCTPTSERHPEGKRGRVALQRYIPVPGSSIPR